MPLKAASVAADVIFPVVVTVCLDEFNACVLWIVFDVGTLSRRDVVRQEPLGHHHRLLVIRLPHGEVVFQIDLETLVPAVVRQ